MKSKSLKALQYAAILIFVLSIIRMLTGASDLTSIGTASAALLLSVPIALAGLGGLFSERSGVVNIGLEGMMIMGAWAGGMIGSKHGPWIGLMAAIIFGAVGALIHAIATITFGVDHVVSGVAINIIAAGLVRYISTIFTRVARGLDHRNLLMLRRLALTAYPFSLVEATLGGRALMY